MKKFLPLISVILLAGFLISCGTSGKNQAQNSNSNGTLEIINYKIPDFVRVKPAEGIKFNTIEVYLVDGSKSYKATMHEHKNVSVNRNSQITYSDQSEILAISFAIPGTDKSFQAKKIRFIVDKKTMHYNLEKTAWEKR